MTLIQSSSEKNQLVAVTSTGPGANDPPDSRFGRCAYFILFRVSDKKCESIHNTAASLGNGAGIQAAQLLVNRNVTTVITQNIGNNAMRVLSEAGIKVYFASGRTCSEVFDNFLNGNLQEVTTANVRGHHGWRGGRS